MASFEDFQKLDIRVGKVVSVEEVPAAKSPIWKLTIDFGPEIGKKTSAAGIKAQYAKEQLLSAQVVAVVNLEPKSIAGIKSEALVLAAVDRKKDIALLRPDKETEVGAKIY